MILTTEQVADTGIDEPDLLALRASHEELRRHLLSLLARAHRDGGHYVEQHGIDKSVSDAHDVVSYAYSRVDEIRTKTLDWADTYLDMNGQLDALRARVAVLKGALRDARAALKGDRAGLARALESAVQQVDICPWVAATWATGYPSEAGVALRKIKITAVDALLNSGADADDGCRAIDTALADAKPAEGM